MLLIINKLVPSKISFQVLFFFLIGASSFLIFCTPFLYILKVHSTEMKTNFDSISAPENKPNVDNLAKMIIFAQSKTRQISKFFTNYFDPGALLDFISKLKLIINYFMYEDILLFLIFQLLIKKYRPGLNLLRSIINLGESGVTNRLQCFVYERAGSVVFCVFG